MSRIKNIPVCQAWRAYSIVLKPFELVLNHKKTNFLQFKMINLNKCSFISLNVLFERGGRLNIQIRNAQSNFIKHKCRKISLNAEIVLKWSSVTNVGSHSLMSNPLWVIMYLSAKTSNSCTCQLKLQNHVLVS